MKKSELIEKIIEARLKTMSLKQLQDLYRKNFRDIYQDYDLLSLELEYKRLTEKRLDN
jgi:hypothetical protein